MNSHLLQVSMIYKKHSFMPFSQYDFWIFFNLPEYKKKYILYFAFYFYFFSSFLFEYTLFLFTFIRFLSKARCTKWKSRKGLIRFQIRHLHFTHQKLWWNNLFQIILNTQQTMKTKKWKIKENEKKTHFETFIFMSNWEHLKEILCFLQEFRNTIKKPKA